MPRARRNAQSSASPSGPVAEGSGRSRPGARGSNAARAERLAARSGQPAAQQGLDPVFDLVLAGDFDGAKAGARAVADAARAAGQDDQAHHAGLVWQVASAFDLAQDAMGEKRFDEAKSHASTAGSQARALVLTGAVDAEDLNLAIESAGKAYNLAKQAADQARSGSGRDAPIVDQHEFDHGSGGVFCGIATMIMMLRANGIDQGSSRADLNALASQVYTPGRGSSGALMAKTMESKGIKDLDFALDGNLRKLTDALSKGQTVPFGVMSVSGTITKLEGGSSKRYPGKRVGERYYRAFQGSGHWVLVTRFEGDAKDPKAFLVNDPDLGGELRCTPQQIASMGEGNGNFWMIS